MKKFLSVAVLIVLVISLFAVVSSAAETYWEVDSKCLVKSKEFIDKDNVVRVVTFKEVDPSLGVNGLLVGLPTDATAGDKFFDPINGYRIEYLDKKGDIKSGDAHIGTTDKVAVYKDGVLTAEYGLVTYGDADGDGVFDVLDAAIAQLYVTGKLDVTNSPAVYEAVKIISGDKEDVSDLDFTQIVNNTFVAKESNKGRKSPIDQTLYFESAIYDYTGVSRDADFTTADADFKKLVKLNYNGYDTETGKVTELENAPKDSGIYSVTATISDSEEYLVTPGTKNLGLMVVAPKASAGNYNIAVDNASKTITVNIENAYASKTTLEEEVEKWLKGVDTLTVGGTQNPQTVASALPNREYIVYSNQDGTLGQKGDSSVLGSYLPDDETLWANNTASNSKTVNVIKGDNSFDFTVKFQQDEATVEKLIKDYFADCAVTSRGQRKDANKLHLYAKEKNNMFAIRAAVIDETVKVTAALGGTGLKGVLVGRKDSLSIQSSSSSDFTGQKVTSLFDSDGVRYSTLNLSLKEDYSNIWEVSGNANKVIPVVNSVLKGLGSSISTSLWTLKDQTIADLNIIGKTGFCNYRCSSDSKGIRYNIVFYIEFMKYDNAEDGHKTLTVGENVTMIPEKTTADKPFEHYLTRMTGGEIINAQAAPGYKLVVKDANGNEVPMSKKGYYVMPNSNATVSAIAE